MARPRKFGGRLSDSERECLQSLIKKPSEQARRIQRARIMLMADEGRSNGQIAEQLHVSIPTIVKTLKKWSSFGIEGALDDLQRSGRRSAIGADAKAWIISLACSRPSDVTDGPAARIWSIAALRKYVQGHCIENSFPELAKASASTIWEILQDNEIRPHQIRYYLEKKDPCFNEKARGVLLLYKRVAWILQFTRRAVEDGQRADQLAGEVVISYDEKPGIQAVGNVAPDLPPGPGHGAWSRDYEYRRLGTVSLLAGIDLLTGEVSGLVRDSHTSADFIDFLRLLDGKYAGELKISVILDNHSVHRSREVMDFLAQKPGRFELIFTPKHASWLNLIESFFSKLARQALRGLRVRSKEELAAHITGWLEEINRSPVIYRWKWSLDDIWGAFTKRGMRLID